MLPAIVRILVLQPVFPLLAVTRILENGEQQILDRLCCFVRRAFFAAACLSADLSHVSKSSKIELHLILGRYHKTKVGPYMIFFKHKKS